MVLTKRASLWAAMLAFLLSQPVFGASIWERHNPLPTGETLHAIWTDADGKGFAVGAVGTILRWDGQVWEAMASGTTRELHGVWGSSPSDVFAVGDEGTILHWDGYSWRSMESGVSRDLYGVWGSSSSNIFAVGEAGEILRWNGSLWSHTASGVSTTLNAVRGISATEIFVVGDSGVILRWTGGSWAQMNSGTYFALRSVWIVSSEDAFAVGDQGKILHYKLVTVPPPGESYHQWVSEPSGTASDFYGVWGTTTNVVHAVGEDGTILRRNDSGWSPMVSGTTATLRALCWSAGGEAFVVGSWGRILRWNGQVWTSMVTDTASHLYGVWGSAADNVFAVGRNGTILLWNGISWKPMTSGTSTTLRAIWGSSANNAFAVGDSGVILRWNGTSWNQLSSGTAVSLRGVWGSSPTNVFAVGYSGTIIRWNGSSWSSMSSGTSVNLYSVSGTSDKSVYAVGGGGKILRWDGTTWKSMTNANTSPLYAVWGKAGMIRTGVPEEVFAAGSAATVVHYEVSYWSSIFVSETAASYNGIWGTSPTNFFVVGELGTILQGKVTWAGTQFTNMTSGTEVELYDVWGSSETDVWVVGEGGTILRLITPTCNGAFNPSAAGFGRGGGDSSISIPVVNGCQIQPVSEAPWIAITSRNDGPEFVKLNYSVATNRKTDRVGSIRAYGRRFWIGQIAGTGCVYTSDRNEDSFGANGGTGTVSIIAASDCPWISRSYASWLTITSGASGKSNGTVTFSVAPNPGAARTGIMIIAGGTFTVQQAGAPANAPPIARIQYGVSGGTLVNAPATPVTLPMAGAPLSVTLDGGQSSDPETSALSYSWTRDTTGMTGGSVNSSGANLPTYNLTFSSNARGTVVVNLTVKDQSNLQHTASITFNLVTANQPPVVHIKYRVDSDTLVDAPSTAVLVDTYVARTITLDGSASADPEGGAISFSWSNGQSLTRGAAALTGQTTSTATLSIDAGTDGTVTVFLAVTETTGAQTSAAIVFRLAQRPTAVIAARVGSTVLTDSIHLEPGASAILDGTGSRCSDGSAEYLNYSWRQTSGIPVTLNEPESATTSFVVPSVEASGAVLTFELTVTDWRSSLAASSAKNLTVDVAPLYFSQVGVGPVGEEELRTVLLFVNNSTQRATNVVLELFDQQGHPLQASVNQQPWSSTPFEIPAFGSKRLDLTSDQVQVGWARVRSNVKLGALALFQVINPASLASRQETSILSSVRGRRFTAYLDVAQETAVAVANPGDLPAIVSVTFKDGTGLSVASLLFPDLPGGRLGPKAHNARFIDGSLLSQLPATFRQGSMVIESDQDIIVTGLKTKSGFVLSSLAMTGDEGMNTTNYFAQLGVGPIGTDELRTVLLLVNNGVSAATGVEVSLLDEQGTPLEATVGGQPWSAVPFDIQGNFARALDFSSNSVQVGWAQVDSNEPVGGLVLFQILNSATQQLLREASILPSAKSKRFATYFNRSDETALAVANPGDLPALVRLKLIDYANGVQRIVVDTPLFPELSGLTLGAKRHSAKFITPSLLGDLPANFSEGTLVIESDRDVTMVVLRTKAGLVLSALPLAAAP